jgi:hypothetical protein
VVALKSWIGQVTSESFKKPVQEGRFAMALSDLLPEFAASRMNLVNEPGAQTPGSVALPRV